MEFNGEQNKDFYKVLGLKKECSHTELKNAYKKLALRWHPDRCSASGDTKYVEESKMKFQAVQEAYSVLSDANKRFLYDVGIDDSDDDTYVDSNQGKADFLSEMATMMRQSKPNENVKTSFKDLKDLFEEIFQSDIESCDLSSETKSLITQPSSFSSYGDSSTSINKRGSSAISSMVEDSSNFNMSVQGFCLGADTEDTKRRGCVRERRGTKHVSKHKTCRNGLSSY